METIIHYPVNATYIGNFKLLVEFENGKLKICNFKDLKTKELKSFGDLKRKEYFKKFLIKDGELQWPNGYDCAPDFLYDIGKSAVIKPFKKTSKAVSRNKYYRKVKTL
ncbi:MAG: DUF2442 domain-containing protein [Ignavibacteriaceae bacterium]|jgi:hypothetical protein